MTDSCLRCRHTQDAHGGDKDCMCGECMWFVSPSEAAESALTEAREQVERLREACTDFENAYVGEHEDRLAAAEAALACLRAALAAEPAAPVAAEEGGEQEAGEVACGCKSEHNASSCPEYRRIMGLGRPNETAPRKTLAERLAEVEGTTPSVAAVRALMRAELAAPAPSGSDEPGNRPATPDANGVQDTKGGE